MEDALGFLIGIFFSIINIAVLYFILKKIYFSGNKNINNHSKNNKKELNTEDKLKWNDNVMRSSSNEENNPIITDYKRRRKKKQII